MAGPSLDLARISLIVDCAEPPQRLPEPRHESFFGVALPVLALNALDPSVRAPPNNWAKVLSQ